MGPAMSYARRPFTPHPSFLVRRGRVPPSFPILPEANQITPPASSGPDSSRIAGGLSPVSSEPGRADGQLHGARRDATTLGAEHVHPARHAPHSRAMSFQSRLVTIGVGVSRTSAARRCSVVIRDWKDRSEEHTSELQSRLHLVCRLLLEKKKKKEKHRAIHFTTIGA